MSSDGVDSNGVSSTRNRNNRAGEVVGSRNPGSTARVELDRLEAIARSFALSGLLPRFEACRATLASAGTLDIAVLGRFKAGKSSLLNSLLERDILPVDVLPTTAVITRLQLGGLDCALIRFRSGETQEVPLEQVPDFVTETRNPENAKQVAMVDLQVRGSEAFRGLRFVDTPGLGSVFAHNSRTAREWLPQVGVALVAVNANSPVSEEDVSLLAEMATHTPETVILLTKADLVPPADLERVRDFVAREAEGHLSRRIPVLPFSVLPGFEPQRQAVRDYLSHLAHTGESTVQQVLVHRLQNLSGDLRKYLQVGLAAAEASERARENLQQTLAIEKQSLDGVLREARTLALEQKRRLSEHARTRFLAQAPQVEAALGTSFAETASGWKGHVGKVAEAYRQWLQAVLDEELGELSHMGAEVVADDLVAAEASFSRLVRAFQDRLASAVEQALGTRLPAAEFVLEIEGPAHPDLSIDRTFDFPIETFWPLVPMALLRPLVLRQLRGRLPWEVEKNLSRLAVQWSEIAWRLIDRIAQQADDFMRQELVTLQELLSQPDQRRAQLRRALEELETESRARHVRPS